MTAVRNYHDNSGRACEDGQVDGSFSKRERMVLDAVLAYGPGTDREIMGRLGFRDPNAVRPRVTGLILSGDLVELRSTKDSLTGKTVRVVGLPPTQLQLL